MEQEERRHTMDDDFKRMVEKDMSTCLKDRNLCIEDRIKLKEHDKQRVIDIDKHTKDIDELFDHKNAIKDRLTIVEETKVSYEKYSKLSKCVNALKTQKTFLPYIAMIFALLASIATVFFIFSSVAKGSEIIFCTEENKKDVKEIPIPIEMVVDAFNNDCSIYGFEFTCDNPKSKNVILKLFTNRSANKCLEKHQFFMAFLKTVSTNWYYFTGYKVVFVYDLHDELVYSIDKNENIHCYHDETIHFAEGQGVY